MTGGKQNVSLRLRAVQVIKYVPMEERNPLRQPMDCVYKEDNPFDAEDTEDAVAEPKKVVKKPSLPPRMLMTT